jgi:hypothetical protein
VKDVIAPSVSLPFPATVLLTRDRSTAGEPLLTRPKLLSVTVELETRRVATPVELLSTLIPAWLLDATQLSIFSSAGALV